MEPPKGFVVEKSTRWKRSAKVLSEDQLTELAGRLRQLQESFGQPHRHGGLGLRKLRRNAYELRLSRDLRLVFLLLKPNKLLLMLCGNHDDVARFIKEL